MKILGIHTWPYTLGEESIIFSVEDVDGRGRHSLAERGSREYYTVGGDWDYNLNNDFPRRLPIYES
jgi:hypothetical protein